MTSSVATSLEDRISYQAVSLQSPGRNMFFFTLIKAKFNFSYNYWVWGVLKHILRSNKIHRYKFVLDSTIVIKYTPLH